MTKITNKNNCYLYFSAITANALLITSGCLMVWPSPVIPKLVSNDTSINPLKEPISVLQISILTFLSPIGVLLGTVILGKLPDYIGRKKTLMIVAATATIFNVALYFAVHYYQFVMFIFLLAINQSLLAVNVPTYVAEIAKDENRGSLGCQVALLLNFGQLYTNGFGAIATVNSLFLLCAIPPFLVLICSFFISESPVYLTLKGNKSGAIEVLEKLGNTAKLNEMQMENLLEKQQILNSNNVHTKISWRSIFNNRSLRKGLIISIGNLCFMDLSGILVVLTYMGSILGDAGVSLSVNLLSVIIILMQLCSAVLAIILIERLGRRPLILTGFFVCGSGMFVLGLYFYFKLNQYELSPIIRWLPVIAITCYVCAFSMGIGSMATVLRTEILPNEFRSVGSSITLFMATIIEGINLFTFPFVAKYLGVYYCMFFYSFCCMSAFVFFYLLLPETKGKSFDEIRLLLSR